MLEALMGMGLIDMHRSWSSDRGPGFASKGIVVSFVEGGPASAYVDFESELTMGRVSLWENGLCDVELLSAETGEQVLYQHHEGVGVDRLVLLLEGLVERIGEARP
ncbi:immunity protein TriTu family protein [Corallococcus silvisoli]|uniref:immunity protein TriTu family protein n=1 Tax=Corallococcus silvisoli TaxID=2697031 RepID=UPI001377F5EB|nr:hypothetical protein [Corallococcus silvisoli]NBD12869.1 hypothetical protein [Corallococcus silvisoli]